MVGSRDRGQGASARDARRGPRHVPIRYLVALGLIVSVLSVAWGFTGIEGFRMTAPPGQSFLGYERHRGRAVEPDIIWEGVVDGWDTPPEMILMPFFQKVWHDMGLGERPDVPN